MTEAVLRLNAAALRLTVDRPYLGTALWSVTRIATDGLGTLAVDSRWRLYYDPTAVLEWETQVLAGVLYHEICHLLRDHAGRGTAFEDTLKWNLAADAEINDNLCAEGIHLPDGAIYPSTLQQPEGLLAEVYYRQLEKAAQPGHAHGWNLGPAGGRCGSAATGHTDLWESATALDGLDDVESDLVRHSVARAIRDHSRAFGDVPAHLRRWADDKLEPRVDWRRELSSAIRLALADSAGAVDYRYSRPSRRQSAFAGVIVPALRQPVPQVAVIVDTSGSISQRMLDTALGEIDGILRALGQRQGIHVLAVDSAIHSCARVFASSQVNLKGGGGTNMAVGLAAAERLRPLPDVAIVVTDGFTPWPAQAPRGMQTIVVRLDHRGSVPGWARRVDAFADPS